MENTISMSTQNRCFEKMNIDILDKERLTTQILDMDKDKDKRKMSRVVGIGIGQRSSGSSISHSTDASRRRA